MTEYLIRPNAEICTRCGERQATVSGQTILGAVCIGQYSHCDVCEARHAQLPDGFDELLLALGPMDLAVVEESVPPAEQYASADELAATAEAIARSAQLHNQSLPASIRAFVSRHSGSRPSA
jgi:hypothetical protein